jgi:uncharacterized protein (TIGR03435 family)
MLLRTLPCLLALAALAAQGQELRFEVASVKPAPPPTGLTATLLIGAPYENAGFNGGPGSRDPGRIDYRAVSLKMLVARAYGLRAYQVSGPGWIENEYYDIAAKAPPGATKAQLGQMLQRLLAERFGVETHRESKPMKVYTLTVAKDGPRLKPAAPPPPAPAEAPNPDPAKMQAALEQALRAGAARAAERASDGSRGPSFHVGLDSATVGEFARQLSAQLNEPVADQSGLEGRYAFDFTWVADGPMVFMGAPMFPAAGPLLFSAAEKQLGLKIEAGKAPVETLVVDKAEKIPTEN